MRPYKPTIRFPQSIIALPKKVKFISVIVLLYSIGWAIVSPFWSIYFQSKLPNLTLVGIILAIQPFLSIFWVLFWGTFIDQLSKRTLIVTTLLFYFPFSFILLALNEFWHFALFTVYHSFIAAILWLSMETYLRRHSPRQLETQSISLFDTFWSLAYLLGPLLGGILFLRFGFNSFYSISLFAALTFTLAIFLPDKVERKHTRQQKVMFITEIKDFFLQKELSTLTFIAALITLANSFLGMLYPILLKNIGAGPLHIGLGVSLVTLPWLFEGYFSSLHQSKKKIIVTSLITAVLYLSLTATSRITIVLVITFLIGLLSASIWPFIQGQITTLMPRAIVGELTSVNFAITQLGAALGPLFGGFLADRVGIHSVFILGSICFAIIAVLLICSKTLNSLQKPK